VTARRDRYREVVETLTRHGLGFLLGTPSPLPRLPMDVREAAAHALHLHSRPEHVRLALEELGTTFIKLGQIVSTRADLLPAGYVAELARLQDAAPPVPAAAVRAVLQDELGRPVDEVFAAFDDVPMASASIGQAHGARLGGAEVVVKVRRPGVVEAIALDLEILHNLAVLVSRAWDAARSYDVVGLVEEFSTTLRAELDYLREADNVERFASAFAGDPRVHIPAVHREATTSRVLTLERIRGIKIGDLVELDRAGVDRRDLAADATGLLCTMVFEDGFFHADPHPGNFFVEPGGRIGLIDFGMVGRIDEHLRENLVRLTLAVTRQDADRVASAVLTLCGGGHGTDRESLTAALSTFMGRYAHRTLGEIPVAPLVADVLALLRTHHLHLPRELSLLVKTLVMADGLGKQLDPDFDLIAFLGPYMKVFVLRGLSPSAVIRRITALLQDAVELGVDAPEIVRRMVAVLERGGFDVHLRAAEIEPLVARAEKVGNRIVAGAITAAFINGVGRIVAGDPSRFRSWERPLLALGFGALGSLGGYLTVTARHRRLL
jgi:ubiquinone biosynthesis protein